MSEMEKGRVAPVGAARGSMPPTAKSHLLTVSERADVQITGVVEVISFDESLVLLKTTAGDLAIEGSALRVNVLDVEGGRLAVTGALSALYYSDKQDGGRRGRRGLFHQ